MKKFMVVLPVLLLLMFKPQKVLAGVDVQISGNGEGSTSNVSVKSNVSSSSTNNSLNNTTTNIRIETNGEVKEYHGTGNQDVRLESGNGKNSVSVSSSSNSANLDEKEASESTKPAQEESRGTNKKNLFDLLMQELTSILKVFTNAGLRE